MRDKRGNKKGALTPEACVEKATKLIEELGVCLFIVDGIHFTRGNESHGDKVLFESLQSFAREASEKFDQYFPVNSLAVPGREEKGFQGFLGDAAWAAINDASVIPLIIAFKEEHYPKLPLHYGVAADGWSDGVELIK